MRQRHCEMPGTVCPKGITKTAIFTNALGKRMELGLCGDHAVEFADPETRKKLLSRAMRSWSQLTSTLSPEEMLDHPAQQALRAHQEVCQQCADVRDWIVVEAQKGISPDDVMHIGKYVVTHCCPVGAALNEAVGRAMKGE